jgi:formate hydrogenlyase subunit 3/multisubunit Na+/H+ antiporter MnhD subunit
VIAGPVLLLSTLLAAAAAIYLLRWVEPVAALLAAGLVLLLALGIWRLPLSLPVALAGRAIWLGRPFGWEDLALRIAPSTQALLAFLLGTASVAFVLAWRTHQGRTFYPLGLVLLATWATVAMLQPLTLAPFALVLAAVIAVFLIQAGQAGETRGAWRQLLFPSLAAPLFLVAAWYMEQAPLNPDDPTPHRIAGWLLVAGFILLLQPAPLHVAVPAVAGQAPAIVAVFLWTGGQAVTLYLLQRFLVTYPWLATTVDSGRWLLWSGIFTAVLGGILTSTQHRLGRLLGYASLYDYGILLIAIALRGTAGLPTAIWLLLTRTLALLTMATGAAIIRHRMESDRLDRLAGAMARLPWAVLALVVGGFALAGMPLTGQFASRWALLQLVAENDPRWALLLLAGSLGVMVGVIRAGQACFGRLTASPVERESPTMIAIAVCLVLANVLLGLRPQLLADAVAAVILPLSTLGS